MKQDQNRQKEMINTWNHVMWLNELITQEYKGKIKHFIRKLDEMEGRK